jgi:excinuclease ABC subunit C
MECFDISNVSSNHIVASMVRFTDGRPDNQNYRRYRIRTVAGQDDFASMAEVIRRRYSRILLENPPRIPTRSFPRKVVEAQRRLAREGRAKIVLPDLVIVDGGKGQLGMAVRELRALGLHELPVIGLAKQREEVFIPGRASRSSSRTTAARSSCSSASATRPTVSPTATTRCSTAAGCAKAC